jgi:hypothetical protein
MANLMVGAGLSLSVALSLSIPATAREKPSTPAPLRSLLLQVSARSDVPLSVLTRAHQEVQRIFERIGVAVDWIGCGIDRRGDDANSGTAPLAIVVAVVSHESPALRVIPASIVGAVVRNEQAEETAWVLFDRIERAADRYALDAGLVLGHTMAHEVGHLLLPRGAHGSAGLMRPTWRMEDLRDGVHGQLGFSEGEAAIIRARLVGGSN